MRLESLRVRGLGPFRNEVSIDFESLGDARLVAITGANGAGKSTLLELGLPGALYRETPTRGSLRELATSRDSMLEATVVNGSRWTIRHLVDQISGKGESLVLDAHGTPVIESAKVSEFDGWAAKHLPAPEVLFASVFGAQGAGGFLAAKPAERKSILLRVLGIERYEEWASAAAERARGVKQQLEVLRARIADEVARGGDVEAARCALQAATEAEARARSESSVAQAGLATIAAIALNAEAAQREHIQARSRKLELELSLESGRAKLTDWETRFANNSRLVVDADAIRAAVARATEHQKQITASGVSESTTRGKADTARAEAAGFDRQADELGLRASDIQTRIDRLRSVLDEAPPDTELEQLRNRAAACRVVVSELHASLEQLQAQRVVGAGERIDALREGLEQIRLLDDEDLTEQGHAIAVLALEADDATMRLSDEAPKRIDDARRALSSEREKLAGLESEVAALTSKMAQVDAARASVVLEATALERTRQQIESARAQAQAADSRSRVLHKAADEERERVAKLRAELVTLEPQVALAPRLEQASERLAELEPLITALKGDIQRLEAELAQHVVPPEPEPVQDPHPWRERVAAAESALRQAQQTSTRAHQSLEQAQASAARAAGMATEQRAIELELGDWSRLAEDLGKKGLQAAEIDAVGPELTELCNDLLRECHGTRFTVRIDTQKLSADGKRTIEGCDVTVLDTVGGREAEGSTFSGGERVIIGEAIALALSSLACRRSGLQGVTLVRDESGAALDPENAEVYVRMLRRAADQVGASRVLFVSHSPAVVELADARIVVDQGKVEVH